jgi:hypothetical protein
VLATLQNCGDERRREAKSTERLTTFPCRNDGGIAPVVIHRSNPIHLDLKSRGPKGPCGFDPRPRYQTKLARAAAFDHIAADMQYH